MGASSANVHEQWLRDRANNQFGLLRDLDLEGRLGRNAIRGRLKTCRLTRVHRGVYAFGHTALREEARWLGALWTCGDDTVLSHYASAAFHGWAVRCPDGRIHLSTTGGAHSRDDITVHRTRNLDGTDVFTTGPLRITHIPRTLVDLADVMRWPAYRALADALPRLHVDKVRDA
jgi:predicted transcriptional regulator of viral defense system